MADCWVDCGPGPCSDVVTYFNIYITITKSERVDDIVYPISLQAKHIIVIILTYTPGMLSSLTHLMADCWVDCCAGPCSDVMTHFNIYITITKSKRFDDIVYQISLKAKHIIVVILTDAAGMLSSRTHLMADCWVDCCTGNCSDVMTHFSIYITMTKSKRFDDIVYPISLQAWYISSSSYSQIWQGC